MLQRSVVRKACCEVVKERLEVWAEREPFFVQDGGGGRLPLLGKEGGSLVLGRSYRREFQNDAKLQANLGARGVPLSPDAPEYLQRRLLIICHCTTAAQKLSADVTIV
jgi:hypothetical protein